MKRTRMTARRLRIAMGFLAAAMLIAAVYASEPPVTDAKPATKAPAAAAKGDPYPLATCIVSGEKIGSMGRPVVREYDGREVRFCCSGCIELFEKDQAAFMKKIDDKIIEAQLPHYPLKNCVVMENDALDTAEGKPVNLVYGNRLVRFCCSECVKEFKKDPAAYTKKIDAAVIKQQKDAYPLDICPVSGEKLGAGAVDHVYGVTLIRLCCKDCIAQFNENPLPTMTKVHEAWMAKSGDVHDNKPGDGHKH